MWATRWLSAAAGLQVPASGVLRRALVVYADHLTASTSATTQADEVTAIHRICAAHVPALPAQQAATQRLEATELGAMPPTLADVLHGPGWADRLAAFTESAEALAVACMPPKPSRL